MGRILWICLGGAIGTGARYLLSGWVLQALGTTFPYGTLAVNVIGSFLLGVIMHFGLSTDMSPTVRLFLSTGCMGGFTTYSTFNYETVKYFQEGALFMALLNAGVTFLVCFIAGVAGLYCARLLVSG